MSEKIIDARLAPATKQQKEQGNLLTAYSQFNNYLDADPRNLAAAMDAILAGEPVAEEFSELPKLVDDILANTNDGAALNLDEANSEPGWASIYAHAPHQEALRELRTVQANENGEATPKYIDARRKLGETTLSAIAHMNVAA